MIHTIENPFNGERIEFRERTDDGLLFGYTLELGGFAVGRFDHVHSKQEEYIAVQVGQLDVRIDGDEGTASNGTRFAILPGTNHTSWNDNDEVRRATIELRPALESRTFFETTFGLAGDGAVNRWSLPGPLQLAVLLDEFDELHFAAAPRLLQRGSRASPAHSLGRWATVPGNPSTRAPSRHPSRGRRLRPRYPWTVHPRGVRRNSLGANAPDGETNGLAAPSTPKRLQDHEVPVET